MRTVRTNTARRATVVVAAVAALFALGAASASAASTLNVTADSNQVRTATSLKVTTALSGSGTAKKQFGAKINLPAALHVDFSAYGLNSDLCSGAAFSTVSTQLGSVSAFDPATCPVQAQIGTATLGSLTGRIYAVRTVPLPGIGVYFDGGTSSPFGRRVNMSWAPGGDGALTLDVRGLPNISTTGLTLDFFNPDRANGLSSRVFEWAEPGDTGCIANPSVTGSTYHWPSIVWPWSTFSTKTATPASLTLNGCDFDFLTDQSANQAGADLTLTTMSAVYESGKTLYGQTIDLPTSIWNNFPGWSGPVCSPSSFSTLSTGLYPVAGAFDAADCPAGSAVGTVTLGGQTGSIYMVGVSPMNQFGVWFNQGVATPYGRRVSMTWESDEQGVSTPKLRVFGLQGAPNAGLTMQFTGANGEPLFRLAPQGATECESNYATSTLYTYPASGDWADAHGPLQARNEIQVLGC